MKHLVIIGAGGYGREVCAVAHDAKGYGTDFDVKGFLDSRAHALDAFEHYPPIIGSPETYVPASDDVFIVALGSIAARRACARAIASRGGRFQSVIHKSVWMGQNVSVGDGTFISNHVVLTADLSIGRHVSIFQHVTIGHDSVIGDFSALYAHCSLGGGVTVGEGASLYPGARIVPRRTIGEEAVVGIGSTVLLNVPARTTVFGSPAAPLAPFGGANH